ANFYVLDGPGDWRVCRYSVPPEQDLRKCAALDKAQKPVALAVSPNGFIYILDAVLGRFIRYSSQDNNEILLGDSADSRLLNIQRSAMDLDPRGIISIAASGPPLHLYQYAPDGSFLADVALPDGVTSISGIGFDAAANVYLATNEGVVRLSLSTARVGQHG